MNYPAFVFGYRLWISENPVFRRGGAPVREKHCACASRLSGWFGMDLWACSCNLWLPIILQGDCQWNTDISTRENACNKAARTGLFGTDVSQSTILSELQYFWSVLWKIEKGSLEAHGKADANAMQHNRNTGRRKPSPEKRLDCVWFQYLLSEERQPV